MGAGGGQGFMNPGHPTLGRHQIKPHLHANHPSATYGGSNTLGGSTGAGSTMTLGRRGHYASLRAARAGDNDLPMLGPNQGQYATLSKGCKTLESSDFY